MLHEGVLVAQDKNIKISVDNRPVFGVITRKKMRLEEWEMYTQLRSEYNKGGDCLVQCVNHW